MWYLVCSKKGRSYRLTPDKDQFQVSRTVGDIILFGDQSVSRKHAVLAVEADAMGVKIVTIKDLDSKYGTYLNGFKLDPSKSQVLSDGNIITFGCQWNEWRFHSKPLVVTSSNMPNEAKVKLRHIVSELGGVVVGDWQESCSHLTMVEILLTAKVVCALAAGIPIVTPDYWEKFKESLDGQKVPPNYEEFIPPLKESILNRNKVSFAINEKRKTIFSGRTFVFSSEKQLKKYKTIVVTAGGDCETLSSTKMRVEDLCRPDMVVMQHVSTTDSQPPPVYDALLQVMRGKGLKPIPESEIGLAILMCSLDMYCNMRYNVVGSVLEGGVVMSQVKRAEVLAEDSQMSVIDSVSIKTEEPDIKTEKEGDTFTSSPHLSVMASSSLSSNGSFKRWQNNQETLPCGETYSNDKISADGNSSPEVAAGPSRKRPPSIEIGEPPPKRCSTEATSEGRKKDHGLSKDLGLSKDPPNQNKVNSVNSDRRLGVNSSTSKRKFDEADNGFFNDAHPKKSIKVKPGSSVFPDFDEDPVALAGDFSALLEEDDDVKQCYGKTTKKKVEEAGCRVSIGAFLNKAREPNLLPSLTPTIKDAPSTSRGGPKPNFDLEEEDKNWIKDAERGLKDTVDSGWGGRLKGIDGKRRGKLTDLGVGMCVKMANLVVNKKPIQREEETPHDSSVVNFKKFRKVRSAGSCAALPVIIGESDLVPHCG